MPKVLVTAAHPDDEILGCGATISRFIKEGYDVRTLIISEGLTSRIPQNNIIDQTQDLSELQKVARKANAIIGVKDIFFLGFGDNRADDNALLDIIKPIEEHINDFKPHIIFTHFPQDVNIDHNFVSRATTTAARPIPNMSVKEIYFFEIQSSTEWQLPYSFSPNTYFDVSNDFEKKIESLKAYECEMRDFPHARSIEAVEALGKWRGSNIGVKFAESFICARQIK